VFYRAQLACSIGREVLSGETSPPENTSKMEYAMFNLLHAVEDIATALQQMTDYHPRRNETN